MRRLRFPIVWSTLMGVVVLAAFESVGHATVAPPFTVRLASDLVPARPGVLYQGRLEIRILDTAETGAVSFVSNSAWSDLQVAPMTQKMASPGEAFELAFSGTPQEADEPLLLEVEIGGRVFERELDLSEVALRRATEPERVVVAEGATPRAGNPAMVGATLAPRITPAPITGNPVETESTGLAKAPYDIRVHGTYGVFRSYVYDDPGGDGLYVGADNVAVWIFDDDGTNPADVLAFGYTDDQGNYDLTFSWDPATAGESLPDIFVLWQLQNDEVECVDPTASLPYTFSTGTAWNYTGTDLDKGNLQPNTQDGKARVQLFSNAYRTWRWAISNGGGDSEFVTITTPNGGPNGGFGTMNFPGTIRDWSERVTFHEYGHNWVWFMSEWSRGSYCNQWNYCDADPANQKCNHCLWCNENEFDSWNEGFPDWMGDTGPRAYPSMYGYPALFAYDFENVPNDCTDSTGDPCECDPQLTEGILAAVVKDFEDSNADNDGAFSTQWADDMDVSVSTVFQVARFELPADPTPIDYVIGFKNRYPNIAEKIWVTAANNGYDADIQAPDAPGSFSSPSHAVNGSSFDNTVDFIWTRPSDDWSGAWGYSVRWSTVGYLTPDTVAEVTDATAWTTPPLLPGTYYATLRAVDRSGNWSGVMATYGPFTIDLAQPTNIQFTVPTGWAHQVVPREADNSSGSSVPAPTTLIGNGILTWWNLRGVNSGDFAQEQFDLALYTDGVWRGGGLVPPLAPGQGFQALNFGPISMQPGRHTFEGRLDIQDEIVESNEGDNEWAKQWVWTPSSLSTGVDTTRPAAPDPVGGWAALSEFPGYNCDGVRFSSSGWWNAVVLHVENPDADSDVRLHDPSTGPTSGFYSVRGWSSRGTGCTDAVLVNRNVESGVQDWDVGIVNFTNSPDSYHVRQIQSSSVSYPSTTNLSLASQEMMAIREVFVGSASLGWLAAVVDVDPADGPVHVAIFDMFFGLGNLADAVAVATTDASGRGIAEFDASASGFYAVAVYRDPKDGIGAMDATLKIQPSTPDLLPAGDPGWHAPIVPRDQQDLVYPWPSVPAPTTLLGDTAPTFFYSKQRNDGRVASGGYSVAIERDGGAQALTFGRGALGAGLTDQFTTGGGAVYPGGRHTLTVRVDSGDAVSELLELNNDYGEQWVWKPMSLTMGSVVSRPAPPDPTGGWTTVSTGEPLWFNQDGLETPVLLPAPNLVDGWWIVSAMTPEGSSDYDLHVYDPTLNPKDGYDVSVATSGWGTGQTELVLFDRRRLPATFRNLGVIRFAGSNGYRLQTIQSIDLGREPTGVATEGSIRSGELIQVYEVTLLAGAHTITLNDIGDLNIDWGISLYPPNTPTGIMGKSDTVPNGIAWTRSTGQSEVLSFDLAAAGDYGLVVWKAGSDDVPEGGDFELVFTNAATAAPETPVVGRTDITGVVPNPFNPRTTVAFEVAEAGPVELIVYDARGARVRTLVSRVLASGRHEATWNGEDDRGRRVSSGAYFARLGAGGVQTQRKLLLLK